MAIKQLFSRQIEPSKKGKIIQKLNQPNKHHQIYSRYTLRGRVSQRLIHMVEEKNCKMKSQNSFIEQQKISDKICQRPTEIRKTPLTNRIHQIVCVCDQKVQRISLNNNNKIIRSIIYSFIFNTYNISSSSWTERINKQKIFNTKKIQWTTTRIDKHPTYHT